MTAILQFEVDKKRLREFTSISDSRYDGSRTPVEHIYMLARTALRDTFNHGGTFVMVVSAEKITIVQRADATDFDAAADAPRKKP